MKSLDTKDRSSKQGVDRRRRFEQEPHLSGAYIRILVRQLALQMYQDPVSVDTNGFSARNLTKFGDGFSQTPQSQKPEPPPQQHRKQVRNRRRVHTSRPYQERLINMAEARREIVTELKFHRAAKKQANEKQQQQQLSRHSHPSFHHLSSKNQTQTTCLPILGHF
ncbi:uncharacterized protein LOC120192520 [Hibiscus syriacus]|uniref:uncharacterized protein LOC120192520 n=1 Tax=Hibiscus syriacus TaxID=106335 RepID=UPI00192086BB|nr:uncharacterized protein LOC120192520 [Hibiscus syriacus]